MSYRQRAAKYVRRQAKQLAKQLDGVRAAEDIEFVHRARVATRRLRAALKMFAAYFAKRKLKRWRGAMRKIAVSLGDARDRDVQIDFLCHALASLAAKECFPGVARVLVQLERDRERLQRKVVKAVDRLKNQRTLRSMRRTAGRILAESEAGRVTDAAFQPEPCVLQRLEDLHKYGDCLADPTDCRRHHAMRIAAKRLRYTLEILRPLYLGRLDECLETMKKLQTLLGEIHDADIWLDHLAAFAATEYDRIVAMFGSAGHYLRLQPGIAFLQEDRLQHRRETFAQLAALWAELNCQGFWDQLRGAVHAEPPA